MSVGDRFAATLPDLPGGLWLLLLFAVPLVIVLAISFGTVDELGSAVYGWNPENYSRAFDPLFVPVLLRSVGYALATAVLCLLIGYPVAYYIARYGGPLQEPADRARRAAVLRQLPRAHLRLGRAARPTRGSSTASLDDLGIRDDRIALPQHAVGGDRRPRLRLPGVHDPADLRARSTAWTRR